MKVTFLTHSSYGEAGGINKYVNQLVKCISKNTKTKEINIFAKINAKIISRKTYTFISKNYLLLKIFLNFKRIISSDIIIITHLNLIPYLFIFLFLKKKIVLFTYGLEVWGANKNFIYKFLIHKINFFVCMREFTKKKLIERYNLKNKYIYSLHNFIDDFKKFKKVKKQNIILTIARLDGNEKFKGIDETLESISLIKEKKFIYYILGDGDDKNRLIQKSRSLKLDKNVKFLGYVSNKKKIEYLRKSKILSMPGSDKTFDTYPYRFSFLEAANYSLNILASKPFNDEINQAKKYGIYAFVNPKNRTGIKKNIIKLLNKKNFISKKLHLDFSKKKFCLNLNKIIMDIIYK